MYTCTTTVSSSAIAIAQQRHERSLRVAQTQTNETANGPNVAVLSPLRPSANLSSTGPQATGPRPAGGLCLCTRLRWSLFLADR